MLLTSWYGWALVIDSCSSVHGIYNNTLCLSDTDCTKNQLVSFENDQYSSNLWREKYCSLYATKVLLLGWIPYINLLQLRHCICWGSQRSYRVKGLLERAWNRSRPCFVSTMHWFLEKLHTIQSKLSCLQVLPKWEYWKLWWVMICLIPETCFVYTAAAQIPF